MERRAANVAEIQQRLDALKTPKQRQRRLREIEAMRKMAPDPEWVDAMLGIEWACLKTGWTAQVMSDWLRNKIMNGEAPMALNVDGDHVPLRFPRRH